ncbi:hypothetical protein BRC69_07875 [Halobacteriales archaeon QH_6_66_25]|nr:MAG: hypothetical protein BRC69_07875 [Halobacteriales archaeon QH_6_66_25]
MISKRAPPSSPSVIDGVPEAVLEHPRQAAPVGQHRRLDVEVERGRRRAPGLDRWLGTVSWWLS